MGHYNGSAFPAESSSKGKRLHIRKPRITGTLLIVCSVAVILASLTWGRYGIPVERIVQIVMGKALRRPVVWPENMETVLLKVRLPRIAAALLIGSALSLAGASYQGLFRNPMVSSDILGASAGAGFGAALGILLSMSGLGVQLLAFVFGLGAVLLTYAVSSGMKRRGETFLTLLLTGMVVSALFASFTSLTKYVADPYSKLPAITFWMMGGLSAITGRDLLVMLIPFLLGTIPLLLIRWKMNVMCFGDEEAEALGVNVRRLRLLVIVCSTLLTAAAVSISGHGRLGRTYHPPYGSNAGGSQP